MISFRWTQSQPIAVLREGGKMSKPKWVTKATALIMLWVATAVAVPAQRFTSLFSFNNTDGSSPQGSPVQAANGNLYGTTTLGGLNNNNFCIGGCGTIYKITPGGKLTTIYNFCSQSNCTDGYWPQGALILSTDGNLYGVTQNGGVNIHCNPISDAIGCGTVFKITPSGTLTTLHSFDFSDGADPYTALVRSADGNFYGVTGYGGNEDCFDGCGTVFTMTPKGLFTTLHSFQNTDGAYPVGALIQGTDGNFYGTTTYGGSNTSCDFGEGCGTVYKITPSGNLTTLYNFDVSGGNKPLAGLVQARDGNFYGTTQGGGANGYGTVFKITPSGTLTTLHSFDGTDGSSPNGPLVQGADGKFYGTTGGGGANKQGSVFKMTATGTLTTLYSFCSRDNCSDGTAVLAGLFQGTNGRFYGTTQEGGAYKDCYNFTVYCGTIFDISVGLSPVVETIPIAGVVGEKIWILGSDLSGATKVTFHGTSARFKVRAKTLIVAEVPSGATTGTVKVKLSSGTLSSNVQFQVLP
jgi:uncharacterized repeat protein (TIGR03803 family)